jgi:erythronate-4-phosphate dehydrogenase
VTKKENNCLTIEKKVVSLQNGKRYVCKMKIVVDDKIPYIREKLEMLADEVVSLRGADIKADDVKDADALIVRTRTRCDEQLLAGSKVQFVATATIGFDHIDVDYMQRAGIVWTNCPGCNATSVAQYVECSLLLLQQQKGISLKDSTIGIVGCGHVGSKVKDVAERLGMRTLVCDPPLGKAGFVTMETIEQACDVITFHVPLTREGRYATWHLADEDFFHRLPRVPYLINTSRGGVVDNDALLSALEEGRVADAVIDVWEHEPLLNQTLLQRVFIGTPHIAGYSADGKVNADNMVIDALCRHFHLPNPGKIVPPSLPVVMDKTAGPLDFYNPLEDSFRLKTSPSDFEKLRNDYPIRREKMHN